MKLSEAIIVGSTKGPQVRGHYTALVDGQRGYCAIGASLAAVGALSLPVPFWVPGGHPNSTIEEWRQTVETRVLHCPAGCDILANTGVDHFMSHLNDRHGWTRERIADWVASIERANEEAAFLKEVRTLREVQPLEPAL